jgi:hypothetical protein
MAKRDKKKHAREARKDAERARQESKRVESRRWVGELLQHFGAPKLLLLPPVIQPLVERRYNEPRLLAGDADDSILDELTVAFHTAEVELKPDGLRIPLRRFFTDYAMLVHALQSGLLGDPKSAAAWGALAERVLPHVEENFTQGLHAMVETLDAVLLHHCHIDGRIYWLRYQYPKEPSGKPRMTVTLEAHVAQSRELVREGVRRPAWRCGLPAGATGIEWVSWPPSVRGAADAAGHLDVYVQSHALEQLYNRLPFEPWAVQDFMWQSLREPLLVPAGRGRWLVEYRFFQHRLGYFVAEEVDGRVLIATFLFLTMEGTPEGNELRQRLRVRTDDVSWLGMDTLSYFVLSDVAKDADLTAVLSECGCGHLFQLLKPDAVVARATGVAARTRQHLEMPLPQL